MLYLHCPALLQVSTNDTAMTLLPLLERPPWVRRGKGGAPEKFVGGAWQAVEARERHRLTQQDGQVGAAAVQLAVGYRLAGDLLCQGMVQAAAYQVVPCYSRKASCHLSTPANAAHPACLPAGVAAAVQPAGRRRCPLPHGDERGALRGAAQAQAPLQRAAARPGKGNNSAAHANNDPHCWQRLHSIQRCPTPANHTAGASGASALVFTSAVTATSICSCRCCGICSG